MFLIHNRWVSNVNFGVLLAGGFLFPTFQFTLISLYRGIVDETRYVIYQNALELAKMVPFTGLGLGNFDSAYWYYFHEDFKHAHNIYINTAVELGLPGLILFTILGASLVYFGVCYAKRQRDPLFYAMNVSLVAVVFGFLVRCLVDYTI
jgi:O-antigen ligase